MSPTLNGDLNDLISTLWNSKGADVDGFIENFASTIETVE